MEKDMPFMELDVTRKGRLCMAECTKCGATLYAHEWASCNFNEDRDALAAGAFVCQGCGGKANPDSFWKSHGRTWYAARYSAPGYLDCTAWEFDRNLRRLRRSVRSMYR